MGLDAEDDKLVTLARMSRARRNAQQGAAVRDTDGRTYTASTVQLPSLKVAALDLAVAMAVSSGAAGLEAAAIVTEGDLPVDLDSVRDVSGAGIAVVIADGSGSVDEIITL